MAVESEIETGMRTAIIAQLATDGITASIRSSLLDDEVAEDAEVVEGIQLVGGAAGGFVEVVAVELPGAGAEDAPGGGGVADHAGAAAGVEPLDGVGLSGAVGKRDGLGEAGGIDEIGVGLIGPPPVREPVVVSVAAVDEKACFELTELGEHGRDIGHPSGI